MYQNKTLVTTFGGEYCSFGQGSVQAGWLLVRQLVRSGGKEIYLLPAIFSNPDTFASMTWFDGLFNWDSAWPVDGGSLTTARDEQWMSSLGSRGYMASISPLFFTYYGPSSWNKDWIYVSGLIAFADDSGRMTGFWLDDLSSSSR
jgi:glucan endo-1,3-alpha-glucosidase